MQRDIPAAIAAAGLAGTSLMLGSCGLFDKPVKPAVSRAVARPALFERRAEGSEAIWGLRAGLNVAALSCRGRGRPPVAPAYARMLMRHRGLLATAHREEQGRQGLGTFDRQQTRVYNTFANQASPVRFCHAAITVAQRANALDSAQFASAAPHMLGELKAALRRP